MKAIRPIFDGKDDLDDLNRIDRIDMMACLFSLINESIDTMKDLDDEQKHTLQHMTDREIRVLEDELGLYQGTEFDELIVMFEIIRWLEECGYEWGCVVTGKYQYIARAIGVFSNRGNFMIGDHAKDDYVLNVKRRAFHDLELMLPLHWATILLDWYPVTINGIDNKEMIEFGNLMIVCNEGSYHYMSYEERMKKRDKRRKMIKKARRNGLL